jgi:hypothetical protein
MYQGPRQPRQTVLPAEDARDELLRLFEAKRHIIVSCVLPGAWQLDALNTYAGVGLAPMTAYMTRDGFDQILRWRGPSREVAQDLLVILSGVPPLIRDGVSVVCVWGNTFDNRRALSRVIKDGAGWPREKDFVLLGWNQPGEELMAIPPLMAEILRTDPATAASLDERGFVMEPPDEWFDAR